MRPVRDGQHCQRVDVALNNIRYFVLHLLPRAEAGAPWTEHDVAAALRWADYCQQAAAAAVGTPAERVLRRLVAAAAAGGARPELDVTLLARPRRALLARLVQNARVGDAALRRALCELRRAGQLDAVLAAQAAQKQAYTAVTAALRRAGGRRRMQARAVRRYLLDGALAGRPHHWLAEKAGALTAGPDGARMAALALAAGAQEGGGEMAAAVDSALARPLAAAGHVRWAERLTEPELAALLRRPELAAAAQAACDRADTAEDADMTLLARLADCDRSGRVRRTLRAALRRSGDTGRAARARLAGRLPRFRLRDPTEQPPDAEEPPC